MRLSFAHAALLLVTASPLPAIAGSSGTLRFTAVVEVPGQRVPVRSETWIKGAWVKIVSGPEKKPVVMLIRGQDVYIRQGSQGGHRTLRALQRIGGLRPHEFVLGKSELLQRASRAGQETAEGEMCDVWVVPAEEAKGTPELTLWIDSGQRLRRVRVVTPDRGEALVRYLTYEDVRVPDSEFEPDPTVDYRELPSPVEDP